MGWQASRPLRRAAWLGALLFAALGAAVPASAAVAGCNGSWAASHAPALPDAARTGDRDGVRTGRASGDAVDHKAICGILERAANSHGVAPDFLARLIWQESRFDANAVSPKGAQGIAQFMPATASERGLEDPFNAASALSHSAQLLKELACEFGNFGLAAAAYNAGAQRVRTWLEGNAGLPLETQDYVRIITDRDVQSWVGVNEDTTRELAPGKTFTEECAQLALLAAKPAAEPDQGVWRPWGVWVAADFSRSRALSIYARLLKRHAKILPQEDPMVVRVLAYSRGRRALQSVRIGFDSRQAAVSLCARLRSSGGACLVVKN